jgi:putative DNA primase/helicase
MWIYRNGIYEPNGKSEVKIILRDVLGNWYSAFFGNQVINKLETDTAISSDVFFSQLYSDEIPVQNGILNIFTRELKPFTPEKIFFNKLPVEYNPLCDCPMIDKFLKEVLAKEDDRQVLYEIGGFILLKEYRFEKAFMFIGNGRNGKDKTLELIKRTIGMGNCCSVPLSSIVPDSFIMAEFFGKLANLSGEISNQDLKETGTFKQMTGRSLISAPRKFLNPITFQNYAKFVFACNELPMVYDTSKGFWDRWVLLEFPYTFVTKEEIEKAKDKTNLKLRDENIIEKITTPQEMSGLLNKFLDGLDRLITWKTFSQTVGSEQIKNFWIRKANSFMAFCLDCIEDDYDGYITKKELRRKYKIYCSKHKITGKNDFVIKRTLEEMYGAIEGTKNTAFNYNERVWEGISWKNHD